MGRDAPRGRTNMSNRYRKFAVAIFTTVLVGLYYMYILPMSGVGKTTAKPGKAVEYEKRRESKPPLASSDLKQPVTPPKITESPISIDTPASLDPPTSTSALASTIHCVGDTFTPRAWAHRSCEFTNICFDRKKNDFVLFKPEDSIAHVHTPEALISSSSSYHLSVSLGGINPRWNWVDDGIHKLEWFPRIVDGVLNENYDRIEVSSCHLEQCAPPSLTHYQTSCAQHRAQRSYRTIPWPASILGTLFGTISSPFTRC